MAVRVYLGFDDTDMPDADRGTGKLVRWFGDALPEGCTLWGVVRQQLLVAPEIPYTSHNSSACAVVDAPERRILPELIRLAVAHLEHLALPGSDPGLCVACEDDPALATLAVFGALATRSVVTQAEAYRAAGEAHLSGHGGTNGGVIGAAAAVGLTARGWNGRFIEFSRLRSLPETTSVEELEASGIHVCLLDRDAATPAPKTPVVTGGWLRPMLLGGCAVLHILEDDGIHRPALRRERRTTAAKPGGTPDEHVPD